MLTEILIIVMVVLIIFFDTKPLKNMPKEVPMLVGIAAIIAELAKLCMEVM